MTELTKRIYTSLILLPLTLSLLLYGPQWSINSVVLGLLVVIILTEWPKLFSYKSITFWTLMPLYPVAPFLAFLVITHVSRMLALYMVLTVIAHDVGSYIAGKLFGKHTIIPTVSPGKTWEGFAGGYCATFLVTVSFFYTQNYYKNYTTLALLAALISSTALAGDLFESYIKRRAGLKDSGVLLPGHGGLLDRLDALMFVAVLFYFLRHPLLDLLTR
ncbi:CDP-archaeol synthase [Candidatus Dependentiae bacterium]|nr:CDP-archaeol synthase [Candidatus Dependentiae bacterium]